MTPPPAATCPSAAATQARWPSAEWRPAKADAYDIHESNGEAQRLSQLQSTGPGRSRATECGGQGSRTSCTRQTAIGTFHPNCHAVCLSVIIVM